jgi:hypothetical protein
MFSEAGLRRQRAVTITVGSCPVPWIAGLRIGFASKKMMR